MQKAAIQVQDMHYPILRTYGPSMATKLYSTRLILTKTSHIGTPWAGAYPTAQIQPIKSGSTNYNSNNCGPK